VGLGGRTCAASDLEGLSLFIGIYFESDAEPHISDCQYCWVHQAAHWDPRLFVANNWRNKSIKWRRWHETQNVVRYLRNRIRLNSFIFRDTIKHDSRKWWQYASTKKENKPDEDRKVLKHVAEWYRQSTENSHSSQVTLQLLCWHSVVSSKPSGDEASDDYTQDWSWDACCREEPSGLLICKQEHFLQIGWHPELNTCDHEVKPCQAKT